MAFAYDPVSDRYRDASTGRFVPERTVNAWIADFGRAAGSEMSAHTSRLVTGTLSLAEWESGMRAMVKDAHLAAAMAAHGGRQRMSQSDYGYVGSQVKEQYERLNAWARELGSGAAPLDGRAEARAALYGKAAHSTGAKMLARDRQRSGARRERNVLGDAEHCSGCLAATGRGWVPLGTLPPVGSRDCRANDRCRIEYSDAEAA